jgi:hypothetical protein
VSSVTTRKRSYRSVDESAYVGIVSQQAGCVVTGVSSNNGVTTFAETWLVHGPWQTETQLQALSDVTVA